VDSDLRKSNVCGSGVRIGEYAVVSRGRIRLKSETCCLSIPMGAKRESET